jgi:hypothetical protein
MIRIEEQWQQTSLALESKTIEAEFFESKLKTSLQNTAPLDEGR